MCEKPNKWIVCISYTFNDTLSRADLINKYWTKIYSKLRVSQIFYLLRTFFHCYNTAQLTKILSNCSVGQLAKILNSFILVILKARPDPRKIVFFKHSSLPKYQQIYNQIYFGLAPSKMIRLEAVGKVRRPYNESKISYGVCHCLLLNASLMFAGKEGQSLPQCSL